MTMKFIFGFAFFLFSCSSINNVDKKTVAMKTKSLKEKSTLVLNL